MNKIILAGFILICIVFALIIPMALINHIADYGKTEKAKKNCTILSTILGIIISASFLTAFLLFLWELIIKDYL